MLRAGGKVNRRTDRSSNNNFNIETIIFKRCWSFGGKPNRLYLGFTFCRIVSRCVCGEVKTHEPACEPGGSWLPYFPRSVRLQVGPRRPPHQDAFCGRRDHGPPWGCLGERGQRARAGRPRPLQDSSVRRSPAREQLGVPAAGRHGGLWARQRLPARFLVSHLLRPLVRAHGKRANGPHSEMARTDVVPAGDILDSGVEVRPTLAADTLSSNRGFERGTTTKPLVLPKAPAAMSVRRKPFCTSRSVFTDRAGPVATAHLGLDSALSKDSVTVLLPRTVPARRATRVPRHVRRSERWRGGHKEHLGCGTTRPS